MRRENKCLKDIIKYFKGKHPTFPVLAISLIPNLLKFLCTATIFPGSPVTWITHNKGQLSFKSLKNQAKQVKVKI